MLLGFDARRPPYGMKEPNSHWCPLRSDVVIVATVDDEVWPSACFSELSIKERPWFGYVQFLWRDLNELKHYITNELAHGLEHWWIIAVTLLTDTCKEDEKSLWHNTVPSTCPAALSPAWSFLGYDVADRFLFSALTNSVHCTHDDYEEIRVAFSQGINSNHLFGNVDLAIRFRDIADHRSPEHKPFFVFGVWRIPIPSDP